MEEKKKLPPGVVSTVENLAAAIGVHRRTVQDWKHKENFPIRSDGTYDIVQIDRWRRHFKFEDEDNVTSTLNDMDHRTQLLIESLKAMQPDLVQSLPEDQQTAFATLLDETIGNAVKESFDGEVGYFYRDYYKGEPEE